MTARDFNSHFKKTESEEMQLTNIRNLTLLNGLGCWLHVAPLLVHKTGHKEFFRPSAKSPLIIIQSHQRQSKQKANLVFSKNWSLQFAQALKILVM